MPSIPSQLLNRIADQAMRSLFSDFSLDKARARLAQIDQLNPRPDRREH